MQHFNFDDKTVLVTGASSGIGEAFARELARRGARLVLVARNREKLRQLSAELGNAHFFSEDLAAPGAPRRLFESVASRGLEIDVLVNNAGFGSHGGFTELPFASQREAIDLNVGALMELAYLFLPTIERRRGGLINVASTAAFQPVPYMAVYGATKAFVLSFSEALWAEYRSRGVRVLALCPGATETAFFARSGEGAALGRKASAEDVVRLALRAYSVNQASVVHGVGNYLTTLSMRIVTREFAAKLTSKLMKPRPAAHAA